MQIKPNRHLASMTIYVTEHARERVRERFNLKGARIIDEVRESILAGRISADPPTGVTYKRRSPRVLYVWNEDRCYPLKMMPGDDNGWFVATVVPRCGMSLAARQLREKHRPS